MMDGATASPVPSSVRGLSRRDLLPLVADITAAYCGRHPLAASDVPAVIKSVYAALDSLDKIPAPALVPAVPIRDSVRPDYLVCLEDGRKLKMLRRHLRSRYDMTPDQYRAKWGLRSDYPMVAPSYSTMRSQMALTWGLGRGNSRHVPLAADTGADIGADMGAAAGVPA